MKKKILRVGNAGGYWGDDPFALLRQVEGGNKPLDYITIDFLAEVTMSIMQKQHSKDPSKGYAHDFLPMLESVLPKLLKNKTRIITNAGGINPKACAEAIHALAKKLGLSLNIALVYGDDILHNVEELQKKGCSFQNMETGQDAKLIQGRIEAANVYFGAWPVVEALRRWEPDLIITGRVTDTGITLAPMIHEFAWDLHDWNKLASGIIAGHMIECGTQVTGGNFSDWHLVPSFHEMGFPIVEMNADGTFIVTKHEGTGGLVSVDTVREQVFYEMGNPKAYITPDVVADFSTIQVKQEARDRVFVHGIHGYEPTPSYKVSMAYADGFKCVGSIIISGPSARKKAEAFAEIFWNRCPREKFIETHTEFLGWNACHRSLGESKDGNEILLRLGARSMDKESLTLFRKLIPSLILSGPPGVAVLSEGIPKVQTVMNYWPALLAKKMVHPKISLLAHIKSRNETVELGDPIEGVLTPEPGMDIKASFALIADDSVVKAICPVHGRGPQVFQDPEAEELPISTIALARSGDKGDTVNIGVLARNQTAYLFLKQELTAQRVKNWFQELCQGKVSRHELDGLLGLNFLLEESLGGGGSCTLRTDAQGKTFSQALLRQKLVIPRVVLDSLPST
ncbi:MAG: DUF1446 domain-containing protein [Oligoflexales bacterium]|nr:DUF1446 domain-containing protein [Oligoflexales bacterium]